MNINFTSNNLNKINTTNVIQDNKPTPQASFVDIFIHDIKNENEKQKNKKMYFWSNTAMYPFSASLIAFEAISIHKIKKLITQKDKKGISEFIKKYFKNFSILFIAGALAVLGLEKYFQKKSSENYNNAKEYFNSINETNAKLSPETLNDKKLNTSYNPATGEIKLGISSLNDPLGKLGLKYSLKHELVHAKQFELIARSKDGIKKINYSTALTLSKTLKKNPNAIIELQHLYNEIEKDKTGKYDNVEVTFFDLKTNLKNCISAFNTILTNEKATYNDIPIFINEKHYQEIIDKKGSLTPDEEKKADEYYEALLDYPPITFLNIINPFSKYYNNPLEKEAYKENPWYTRIL